MPRTSCTITFGLYDTTARQDASYETDDKQPFVNFEDFKREEGISVPKFATLEQNQFLLDGTFELFPDEPAGMEWGLWSRSMSDGSGNFATPPKLVISFSENHTSPGLTLYFYKPTDDFINNLIVRWYDEFGNLISTNQSYPDGTKYFISNSITDYRRIEIEFISTNNPYRFLKLAGIDFGRMVIFASDGLISAKVLEEIDPTAASISINTLETEVYSTDKDFSLLDPQGMFSLLQQQQRLDVTETVNGESIYMGAYYLDTWDEASENSLKLTAVDKIGIIDKTNFYGGIYDNILSGELIAQIMDSAGAEYDLDESLRDIPLSGHLPIASHRVALQQVALVIGAYVDCSRSDAIKIYSPPMVASILVERSRIFLGSSIGLRELVTGVNVTSHRFVKNQESTDLLEDTLPAGQYEVTFSSPAHSLEISSGASIVESNVNYAIINVERAGEVVLTGLGYTDSQIVFKKRAKSLPANATQNTLSVENATLVSAANANNVAERIYDYYQKRYEFNFEVVANGEENGDYVMVNSLRGEYLRGGIEAMEINLTGGFLANIKLAGVRASTTMGYYVGELYANEAWGVI